MGVKCKRYEKIAIFDQYLASWHIVNGASVICCKQRATGLWQVGDTLPVALSGVLIDHRGQTRMVCLHISESCL